AACRHRIGTAVPFTVPAFALECFRQDSRMAAPYRGTRLLVAAIGQSRERRQGGVQKPAEPDAFASSLVADPVHAVIPVSGANQRQTVATERKTLVERACAMFEQGGLLVGHGRLKEAIGFAVVEHRPV